ncbi:hypothetical protein DL769_003698 [Monosporascus sp. CRB-8-3]|nr:hypothetical protein DL769_003698 [Monosporascus sp. CRB-8-3]
MEFLIKPKETTMPSLAAAGWRATGALQKWQTWDACRRTIDTLDPVKDRKKIEELKPRVNDADRALKTNPSLDEHLGFWRVELVSRAMTTSEPWQQEVNDVFRTLTRNYDILLTKGCSMHVHVSPRLTPEIRYTMPQLRGILKAIAYYDQSITKIMPADRKNNEWAMSNFLAPNTLKAVKDAYAAVPRAGWVPLFALYDKIRMVQNIHRELHGSDRYMSWNFSNVTDECGTIEFRRPPGVDSAVKARHWAGFALAFIAQGMATDWRDMSSTSLKFHVPVPYLARFVDSGEKRLESASRGALKYQAVVEDTRPATVYSVRELAVIKRKKAAKEKEGSPFAQKQANSRPNTPSTRSNSPGAQSTHSNSSRKFWKK